VTDDRQPKFAIGHQYATRGKHSRLCTVTDILKTYNHEGRLVKIRYVSTHLLAGQIVINHDVVETTIAMGAV
jgi:hypothetical protein